MASDFAHYLDALIVLGQKDFKLRYRSSVLGFIWSLLNPLAYMLILTVVFSFLLRVSVPNFPAWLLIGLLVWRFFAIGTSQGLTSLIEEPSLVTKVNLPRYLIVLSSNTANLLGASLEFVTLLPLLFLLGVNLTPYVLVLPVILLTEFLLVFGVSLLLSSLTVSYRDFNELWTLALQLGFFLSPIVYDSSLIPSRYLYLYSINPITRLIESTRAIFLQHQLPSQFDFSIVISSVLLLLLVGGVVFRSLEGRFAEQL